MENKERNEKRSGDDRGGSMRAVYWFAIVCMLVRMFDINSFLFPIMYLLVVFWGIPMLAAIVHSVYVIVRMAIGKKTERRTRRLAVSFAGLYLIVMFCPLLPNNYCISRWNPCVEMVVYEIDIDGWRGGQYRVFRIDGVMDERVAYRGDNGSLSGSEKYVRKGDTVFVGEKDTFVIRRDERLMYKVGEDYSRRRIEFCRW